MYFSKLSHHHLHHYHHHPSVHHHGCLWLEMTVESVAILLKLTKPNYPSAPFNSTREFSKIPWRMPTGRSSFPVETLAQEDPGARVTKLLQEVCRDFLFVFWLDVFNFLPLNQHQTSRNKHSQAVQVSFLSQNKFFAPFWHDNSFCMEPRTNYHQTSTRETDETGEEILQTSSTWLVTLKRIEISHFNGNSVDPTSLC